MRVKNFVCRLLACMFVAVFGTSFLASCQETHSCTFDYQNTESKFLKSEATCQSKAEFYYSCSCGKAGEETFFAGELVAHKYDFEKAAEQYLKSEATFESPAIYYLSCVCGAMGEDTFLFGEKLKEYTEEEKLLYKPTSLTMTLYDAQNSIYGFTYNIVNKPLRPVLQIWEAADLEGDYFEYSIETTEYFTYNAKGQQTTYYVCKCAVKLKPSYEYAYRIFDKQVNVGSDLVDLKTKDSKAVSVKFSHISDSQVKSDDNSGVGTGQYLRRVLTNVNSFNDFLLHSGDVVQYGKYEEYWKGMLDDNFSYLSKIPMMAISGNHEVDVGYSNGNNELFKHFHNKLPEQSSTKKGYYYSFVYGDVKIIMLNTNDRINDSLKEEQYLWLENELKENTCNWTVVAMHHPMYSLGKYGAELASNAVSLALRSQLQGLFAQYEVDLVLQGHDHLISRTFPIDQNGESTKEEWQTINGIEYSINPKGTVYVMNGPAGNQTRSPIVNNPEYYQYAESSYACSWADIEISGNYLTINVKYCDGDTVRTYTRWGIKKSFSVDSDWSNWI